MTKPYQAKSLKGAERRVRDLERRNGACSKLLERYTLDRRALAMLAATGPAFYNPLNVFDAQHIRDAILARECNMKPDGSPL